MICIELPKLDSDGKNVTSLEGIREDVEVAVTDGTESSQTILYVHWKRQIISIQCKSQLHEHCALRSERERLGV
jgi:hypothetical protein